MGRSSYLHPTYRKQIGPSSHKNEYRKGVLIGNWQEERLPKTQASASGEPLPVPTTKAEFKGTSAEVRIMERTPDLPRDLLFGHPASSEHNSQGEMRQIDKFHQKRKQWAEDRDPDANMMKTQKQNLMDTVGEAILRDKQILHETSIKKGSSFTKSFASDHRNMSLRSPY